MVQNNAPAYLVMSWLECEPIMGSGGEECIQKGAPKSTKNLGKVSKLNCVISRNIISPFVIDDFLIFKRDFYRFFQMVVLSQFTKQRYSLTR